MEKILDCCIIGGGPAGITAAIYAKRACLDILLLEKNFWPGGQITVTNEVDNYPGLPGISGAELGEKFMEHGRKLGAEVVRDEVTSLNKSAETGNFHIYTKKNEYVAKTVIMATGAHYRELGVPGEEELTGMGISHCAVCDGAFYRDAVAAVVGGGNTALEDAIYLSGLCKKVYLIHRRAEFRGDKSLQNLLKEKENVEIFYDTVVTKICGEDEVQSLELQNIKTEEKKVIDVEGLFIAVGMIPNTAILEGIAERDAAGYICAGEDCETSLPGLFAVGDIRTKKLRQVITAAADGANAVFGVQQYLLK